MIVDAAGLAVTLGINARSCIGMVSQFGSLVSKRRAGTDLSSQNNTWGVEPTRPPVSFLCVSVIGLAWVLVSSPFRLFPPSYVHNVGRYTSSFITHACCDISKS